MTNVKLGPSFDELRDMAADAVWNSGSVTIANNPELGEFRLQVHRDFPDAPLSPIYLSLRPYGVKTGKLTQADIGTIGHAMASYAQKEGLFNRPRAVAGIPAAGEPFTSAMHDHLGSDCFNLNRFHLTKVEDGSGQTRIVQPDDLELLNVGDMQEVILVDDLVTKAGTKKQAIEAVEGFGAHVSDLIVFVDRSGGKVKQELAQMGVTLHVIWDFDHLLEYWAGKGYLGTKDNIDSILPAISSYPQRLQDYLQTVG